MIKKYIRLVKVVFSVGLFLSIPAVGMKHKIVNNKMLNQITTNKIFSSIYINKSFSKSILNSSFTSSNNVSGKSINNIIKLSLTQKKYFHKNVSIYGNKGFDSGAEVGRWFGTFFVNFGEKFIKIGAKALLMSKGFDESTADIASEITSKVGAEGAKQNKGFVVKVSQIVFGTLGDLVEEIVSPTGEHFQTGSLPKIKKIISGQEYKRGSGECTLCKTKEEECEVCNPKNNPSNSDSLKDLDKDSDL